MQSLVLLVLVAVPASSSLPGSSATIRVHSTVPRLLQSLAPARAVLSSTDVPCDDPDGDPWIAEAVERALDYDGFLRFASRRFGEPVECEGNVTDEFDGAKFGALVFRFEGGATFELETLPPETSVVTLRDPAGFAEPGMILDALRTYAAGRGLAIAWEAPERTVDGDEVIERYWDADQGLNASASFVRLAGALVAVRLSMAL